MRMSETEQSVQSGDESETLSMVDLQDRLVGEDAGAIKVEILGRLNALYDEIAARRQAGMSPEEYDASDTIVVALRAAMSLVR